MHQSTRPQRLIVIADHAPGVQVNDSADIWWWLATIGPTSSVCALTLARHARPADTTWDTETLTPQLGLGGSCSKLWACLDRLAGSPTKST